MVSSYKGGIVTGRRTIIETVPGYSFCGVYTVLVSRRPPEEIGVNAPGYSISGGGYTSSTVYIIISSTLIYTQKFNDRILNLVVTCIKRTLARK